MYNKLYQFIIKTKFNYYGIQFKKQEFSEIT